MQEESIPIQEVVREGILTLNPLKAHQQCEVTTLEEDRNKNGKRNPETVRETQITGKKARKLSKKKTKLGKLQKVKEKSSQEASLQALNLAEEAESRRMGLLLGEYI
jgi:hypothetical protein